MTTYTVRPLIILACVLLISVGDVTLGATSEEVSRAIKRGQDFLLAAQSGGNWEPPLLNGKPDSQEGGRTALATYALLASGVNAQDPKIKSAVDCLMKNSEMRGIYAIGIRAQIWHLLPRRADYQTAAKRDAQLLLEGMGKTGNDLGMYAYTTTEHSYHNSPAQYGVLGMWACEEAGVEVSSRYWQAVQDAWQRNQQSDGGWSYHMQADAGHPVMASMTAAGVATLFITLDYLGVNVGAKCKAPLPNKPIERGMQWMAQNFTKVKDLYTWYGVERIGVASGYKFLGESDWYQVGANTLLKQQDATNGSWNERGTVVGTSYALLFLSKGSAPVVMNKLQYATVQNKTSANQTVAHAGSMDGADNTWNTRPRDAANVVRWMGREIEQDLNWQITGLSGKPEDMLDAPILYLAGNKAPVFSEVEQAKLKRYAELGGLILGHADCGALAFSVAFRKLGTDLFPDYTWRELPDTHPIYTRQQFMRASWKTKPSVIGLSNGTRELMLLIPQADPGATWQTRATARNPEHFQLMACFFQSTIDIRSIRRKGETWVVTPDSKIKPAKSLNVARLKFKGNWNPEPAGWERIGAVMLNTDQLRLEIQTVEIGSGRLKPADTPFAHLTTVGKLRLDTVQWNELRAYVLAGGCLLIDVAGGDAATALEVENDLEKIAPDLASQFQTPIALDDPFYAPGREKFDVVLRAFAV